MNGFKSLNAALLPFLSLSKIQTELSMTKVKERLLT